MDARDVSGETDSGSSDAAAVRRLVGEPAEWGQGADHYVLTVRMRRLLGRLVAKSAHRLEERSMNFFACRAIAERVVATLSAEEIAEAFDEERESERGQRGGTPA